MKYCTPSNVLTISRLVAAPILLPISISAVWGTSLLLFTMFASTDFFDGYCARLFNQETKLGKWLDPLADKVLLASAMFPLVALHLVHWAVALIFVIREFVVLGLRHVAVVSGISVSVSQWGKLKTVFQFIYLALCLFPAMHDSIRWLFLSLALVSTLGSMLHYGYCFMYAMHTEK